MRYTVTKDNARAKKIRKNNYLMNEDTLFNIKMGILGRIDSLDFNRNGITNFQGTAWENCFLEAGSEFEKSCTTTALDLVLNAFSGERVGIQCKTYIDCTKDVKLREHRKLNSYFGITDIKQYCEDRRKITNDGFLEAKDKNKVSYCMFFNAVKTPNRVFIEYTKFEPIGKLDYSACVEREHSYVVPDMDHKHWYRFEDYHTYLLVENEKFETLFSVAYEAKKKDYASIGEKLYLEGDIIIPFANFERNGNLVELNGASFLNLLNDKKAGCNARSLGIYDEEQRERLFKIFNGNSFVVDTKEDILKIEYCPSRNEISFKDSKNSKNTFGKFLSKKLGINEDESITLDMLKKEDIGGIRLSLDKERENTYILSFIDFDKARAM